MGSLGHVVLALAAVAAAEAGFERELAPPWLLIALVPVPFALAWAAQRLFLKGHFRAGELLHRALAASGPLLFLAALLVFGWRAAVGRWSGGNSSLLAWPDLRVLVVIAPWIVFELLALQARARAFVAAPERDAWLGFQARMLIAGLVPVVIYVVAAAIVGANDSVRVAVEEIGVWHAVFTAGLLVTLALGLPLLLEHVWDTAPLPPGTQRDALLRLARDARFGTPRLRVWRTGNQLANAAIVGMTRTGRTVLFSDLLLSQLPPRELAAVFAHEIGHAVRSHVLVFLAWVLAAFLLGDFAARTWFEDEPILAGGVLLLALALWFVSFIWMSRRAELQADLHALDVLGETHTLMSALERVGGRFRDVAGWRHFSVADRVKFLERVQIDPAVGEELHRTLRIASRLGIALFCIALALHGVRLVRDLPVDRLRADLRLGDYATAAERAVRIDGLDPALAEIARLAGTLGADDVPIEHVERAADEAEVRGDAATAEAWRALMSLRP